MTTIPNSLLIAGVYLGGVFLATVAATYTIGYRWQRNELARRAVGIGTVMGLGLPAIAAADLNGLQAWALLVGGFVVAGAVRSYRQVNDDNQAHDSEKRAALDDIDRALNDES